MRPTQPAEYIVGISRTVEFRPPVVSGEGHESLSLQEGSHHVTGTAGRPHIAPHSVAPGPLEGRPGR